VSEELATLRQTILSGQYTEALALIDDLDEMSKKAVLRTIRSYLVRLMSHLVKNQMEQRLTNSWAASIRGSVIEIQDLNRKESGVSFYLQPDDWAEYVDEAFEDAVYEAAAEAFEGVYRPPHLMTMLDRERICQTTLTMLADTCSPTRRELSERINHRLGALPGGDAWQKH
jgi:hypothetical protein